MCVDVCVYGVVLIGYMDRGKELSNVYMGCVHGSGKGAFDLYEFNDRCGKMIVATEEQGDAAESQKLEVRAKSV